MTRWPWSKNKPYVYRRDQTSFHSRESDIDKEKKDDANRLQLELERTSLLAVRIADLERRTVNTDDGLSRLEKRVETVEGYRTPNQQLAEGLGQIIKKLATMDQDKQRLADELRQLYTLVVKSPDWLFKTEIDLLKEDKPIA